MSMVYQREALQILLAVSLLLVQIVWAQDSELQQEAGVCCSNANWGCRVH
jgi:hypothetical protein